jgi:hypothetical protein
MKNDLLERQHPTGLLNQFGIHQNCCYYWTMYHNSTYIPLYHFQIIPMAQFYHKNPHEGYLERRQYQGC